MGQKRIETRELRAADPADNRSMQALRDLALTVLLDRAGGEVVVTQAEYEAIVGRYGGTSQMALHFEVVSGDGPTRVRAQIQRKPPRQGDLVS